MANIDEVAFAIGADSKNESGMKDWFGRVVSTSPFKVARLGSIVGADCVRLVDASIGDMVYVIKRPDGQHVAIGKVGGTRALFDDEDGTTGDVTLSQSAADFEHMRIYFKKSNGHEGYSSVDVSKPNGKRVNMTVFEPYHSEQVTWFASRTVDVSGTSITTYNYANGSIGSSRTGGNSNEIEITRVEAW